MPVRTVFREFNRHATRLTVLLPLLALSFVGCGSGGRPPISTELVPYTPEQQVARDGAKNARYRLRDGDRFGVSFKFEPDLNVENVLVLPDGYVALKGLSEPVRAAGMTIEDLDRILETAYGKDYKNPDLSILVLEIEAPEVYVLGAVKQPGLYRLPEKGRGIIQAIAMAGGYDRSAKNAHTILIRAADGGFMTRRYDLSHLSDGNLGDMAMFDLQPYDIVYVPRKGLYNLAESVDLVFGSVLKVSGFFWDIYAATNLDKIQTVVR